MRVVSRGRRGKAVSPQKHTAGNTPQVEISWSVDSSVCRALRMAKGCAEQTALNFSVSIGGVLWEW